MSSFNDGGLLFAVVVAVVVFTIGSISFALAFIWWLFHHIAFV